MGACLSDSKSDRDLVRICVLGERGGRCLSASHPLHYQLSLGNLPSSRCGLCGVDTTSTETVEMKMQICFTILYLFSNFLRF